MVFHTFVKFCYNEYCNSTETFWQGRSQNFELGGAVLLLVMCNDFNL